MTYFEKIIILKSLAIPKVTFFATYMVVPLWVIDEINKH